ncbi:hypothetical protein [Paenibacillus ginsengihumi]|uniref:hypothetical protein n=1 Tax=Paenibacillus ginsengihumi TaxID=431596 RepID=UPI000376FF31|nr:hypothetical protein [Paenibacillus ginsengihumi]
MRRMIVKHDFDFPDQTVHKGTILDVEDEPAPNGLVFILSGDLKYRSVHIDHLDELNVVEIHQELLQRREEVAELMRRLELAEKAGENAAREVNRLSAELEQRKPVVLPGEVAKAIEWARKSVRPTNRDILEYVINPDGSYPTIVEWGRTNFDELLEALVNGYTIKEPDIRSEIQMIVEDSKDDYEMIDQLADLFQTRLDQEGSSDFLVE